MKVTFNFLGGRGMQNKKPFILFWNCTIHQNSSQLKVLLQEIINGIKAVSNRGPVAWGTQENALVA